jgi:uncharacterized protein
MRSALYTGRLRHRRQGPRPHAFSYSVYMAFVDLAELDEIFRNRWLWSTRRPALMWLRRADFLGDPAISLDEAVRRLVHEQTGRRPAGAIRMLAQLRSFGRSFNPVTFYYCFAPDGEHVESIVAEITNTPWEQRHAYVLPVSGGGAAPHRFRLDKRFHVSPFMPMQQQYLWHFSEPRQRLRVHMETLESGRRVFDATLVLKRREITGMALVAVLLRFPASALQTLGAIYWQALRLWMKRTPFHAHP